MRYYRIVSDNQVKKVGIKYCGGCNLLYDRVGLVYSLKEQTQDSIEFINYDGEDAEFILFVAGCEKACVDMGRLKGWPIYIIDKEKDAGQLIDQIKK
jgi:hypothetical protein